MSTDNLTNILKKKIFENVNASQIELFFKDSSLFQDFKRKCFDCEFISKKDFKDLILKHEQDKCVWLLMLFINDKDFVHEDEEYYYLKKSFFKKFRLLNNDLDSINESFDFTEI